MRLFLLFLLLYLSACSPFQPQSSDNHGNHSEAIARLMHETYEVMYRQNRSELERDEEKQRYLLTLSRQLKMMSRKMDTIVKTESFLTCKTNRAEFEGYVSQLHKDAEAIAYHATHFDMKRAENALQHTLNTCNRCHDALCVDIRVMEP